MAPFGLLALAAAQTAAATLGVGATVVRPQEARISVGERRVAVQPPTNAIVSAEGGSVRRTGDGSLLVTPSGPGPVRIVFTY